MIGKVMQGKSFRGCLLYVMNDKVQKQTEQVMKDRAEVLVFNECFGTRRELIEQFNDVRKLNPKVAKPVLHISLRLSDDDKVSREQLVDMSRDCAKKFGFENNQYIAVLHKDTQQEHIHIVVNRIGFDGKTVTDSHNFRKIAELCRILEEKHHLKKVLSPRLYLSKAERLLPRIDDRKLKLRECIRDQLHLSKTLQEFKERMKEKGYQVQVGRGISFTDDRQVKVKGSELDYSLKTIEGILHQQTALIQKNDFIQERRHRLMLEEQQRKHRPTILDHSREARLFSREESMPDELNDNFRRRKKIRGHGHGR